MLAAQRIQRLVLPVVFSRPLLAVMALLIVVSRAFSAMGVLFADGSLDFLPLDSAMKVANDILSTHYAAERNGPRDGATLMLAQLHVRSRQDAAKDAMQRGAADSSKEAQV
jgi:hypothetical protein